MKSIITTFSLLALFLLPSHAEEKKMWAKSFIGKKAPEFVVETWISEKPDTEGKYILIDFWATWCGPCRKVIPELNAIHKKFKDKLVVIGLSDESTDKVKEMKSPSIEYYSAVDTQARMKKALEVKGIPHVIIIDPKGIVRWEGYPLLSGHKLTEEVIENLLKPATTKP